MSSLPGLEEVRRSRGYRLLAQRVEVDLEQRFKQLEVGCHGVHCLITLSVLVFCRTFDCLHGHS